MVKRDVGKYVGEILQQYELEGVAHTYGNERQRKTPIHSAIHRLCDIRPDALEIRLIAFEEKRQFGILIPYNHNLPPIESSFFYFGNIAKAQAWEGVGRFTHYMEVYKDFPKQVRMISKDDAFDIYVEGMRFHPLLKRLEHFSKWPIVVKPRKLKENLRL